MEQQAIFMCYYPKLIVNPKYRPNKKNKGVVPKMNDPRVQYVPIGCGSCQECMKKKARDWTVRLEEELKYQYLIGVKGYFVTLTFSEESLVELEEELREDGCTLEGYDLENEIAKKAVRRWSDLVRKKNGRSVKRWLVTELGGTNTERIHLHGIVWTDDITNITEDWKFGYSDPGKFCNERTVGYIVKYLFKQDGIHKEYKPKIFCSPGIGGSYKRPERYHKFQGKDTNELYRNRKGFKMALPIYYRNKVFTEEEREKLWLQKLDEQVRYIDGVKVDISEGEEVYYEVLKLAREKNKRLGFGDDSINWDRRIYERQRRKLQKLRRIAIVRRKEELTSR